MILNGKGCLMVIVYLGTVMFLFHFNSPTQYNWWMLKKKILFMFPVAICLFVLLFVYIIVQ